MQLVQALVLLAALPSCAAGGGAAEAPRLRGAAVAGVAAAVNATELLADIAGRREAVARLAQAAATLREELMHVLPEFINASEALAAQQPLPQAGPKAAPVEGIVQAAQLLTVEVAQVLPAFLPAADQALGAGGAHGPALAALAAVAGELRAALAQRFLPAYINATRAFLGENFAQALPPHGGNASVSEELATLGACLPLFIGRAGRASWPNPQACVADIASELSSLVAAAGELGDSSADCGPSGASPVDCAEDVATLIESLRSAASRIGAASFDCGNSDEAGCTQMLAVGYARLSASAAQSVLAASSCSWPRASRAAGFTFCEMGVLGATSALEDAIGQAKGATEICGAPPGAAAAATGLQRVAADMDRGLRLVLAQMEGPVAAREGR